MDKSHRCGAGSKTHTEMSVLVRRVADVVPNNPYKDRKVVLKDKVKKTNVGPASHSKEGVETDVSQVASCEGGFGPFEPGPNDEDKTTVEEARAEMGQAPSAKNVKIFTV